MSDKIIPSIYNYCDRWCEKCAFAERCTVGLDTFVNDKNPEIQFEDFSKIFEESLKSIKAVIDAELTKMGLDPEEIEKEAIKELPMLKEKKNKAKSHPLFELSNLYATETHKFLEANYYKVKTPIVRNKAEIYETIQWYHTMIPAKANRVCFALDNSYDFEDPIQNDKNGTAKVLDICIKKSMAAWHKLMEIEPEFEDDCLSSLVALDKLLLLNKTICPDFMKFIRPGFDEGV